MILKLRIVRSNLLKKGFIEIRDSRHIRYVFAYKGERTSIYTLVSYGTSYKDISDKLISYMADQCRITKSDFVKLATCEISEADYIELVKHHLPNGR